MSSHAYERPVRAVPDLPEIKAKFAQAAYLKQLRDAAYSAYYQALSLASSSIRWALSQAHRLVEASGGVGVLAWVSGQVKNIAGLIREAGVVPSVLAVVSAPPVAAVAARAVRSVGRGVVHLAKKAWTGLKGLMTRCGSAAKRIAQGLSGTATRVVDWVKAVAKRPVIKPVVRTLKATLTLVRPLSQGYVAHRLLGSLVPVLWLRTVIGLLFVPFLVDPTTVANVWDWATTQPANPDPAGTSDAHGIDEVQGTDDSQDHLLINTFGTAIPMPTNGRLPNDTAEGIDVAVQTDEVERLGDEGPFLNRAERRAQQRQDGHNRRTHRRP